MKAKIVILILLSSLILGCRTKQKSVSFTKEGKTEIERVKLDSVKSALKKEEQKSISEKLIKNKEREFSGDIIIKGKSDSLNPLIFHNIINGDTLQSISINGKADYYINNHYKNSEQNKNEYQKEEKLNIIQDVARKSVSKETIKDFAKAITNKSKDLKVTDTSTGIYITFIILGVVVIILFFVFLYFKRKKQ